MRRGAHGKIQRINWHMYSFLEPFGSQFDYYPIDTGAKAAEASI